MVLRYFTARSEDGWQDVGGATAGCRRGHGRMWEEPRQGVGGATASKALPTTQSHPSRAHHPRALPWVLAFRTVLNVKK